MNNPLLTKFVLPPFSKIKSKHILPAITTILDNYRKSIEIIINNNQIFSWDNLCQPLEETNNTLSIVWNTINHLNTVQNTPELRKAYTKCLILLAEFNSWVEQHTGLYDAYHAIKSSPSFSSLKIAQRKSIENKLRYFQLAGINLSVKKKKRCGEITKIIAKLANNFENNVLDATMDWIKIITNVEQLAGIPKNVLSKARALAKSKGEIGWLFTLDISTYMAIMLYAENSELRKEIYYAYNTRASDQGPSASKWDNSKIIEDILSLRYELAQLLGFNNYAEKSIAENKMAKSPQQVLDFLTELTQMVYYEGTKELIELREFVQNHYNIKQLEPWDLRFYSEKYKQYKFSINSEKLREYFPEQLVINGLMEIIYRIYNVIAKERHDVDIWHPDVRFFELYNEYGKLNGSLYLDLYARENKYSGAWMNIGANKLKYANGDHQNPVAYIICNFNHPIDDNHAIFTHEEVITLFHEFGHGLHHILTKIDIADVSGINGVPLDAVELPSQFMENWCWEPEVLNFLTGHYKTGEKLPEMMLNNMLSAKNYQSAISILRQLEYAIFDFRLHSEYSLDKDNLVLSILQSVRKQVALVKSPKWYRFPHAFSHIFAGDYAAGYYSYLWAEVLAKDAFSRFNNEGIFNKNTGLSFLNNILSRGGSEDPIILFERFRGRKPKIDAMLNSYDIEPAQYSISRIGLD